ncbi:MAG: hypothetical protein P4L99_05065 [Chthoniobacter sp.]|nr:hypothetical protein [Chthoniobacter sp.]
MARKILRFLLVLALLALIGAAYACWPRQGNLRSFDADAVGRLETGMWRDYYAHDYQSLARRLYSLYRDQYHFSPADSAQLAYDSGKAAQLFQPTASRAEAQVALPLLVSYYTLLRDRSGESFDADNAARLELDWWQLRRENATPVQYGKVVAQVAVELFKTDNEHIQKSAQLRAAMMRYRDNRRDGHMQAEDWEHIEENLIESYRELKAGVARTPKE